MWPFLSMAFSGLFGENGPLGQYFKTKAQTAQLEQQKQLEIKRAEIDFAKEEAQARVEQQKNQLAATSQTFKAVSYFFLTAPIILVCLPFTSSYGEQIFHNLGLVPSWYAQLYVAVVATIWGLPVAANAVNGIFSSVQEAWAAKREFKTNIKQIESETVIKTTEAQAEVDKKYFDTLRKLGPISQEQVDAYNVAKYGRKEGSGE